MRTPFDPPARPAAHPLGRKVLRALCAALFWLALWQCVALLVGREVYLPAPLSVARRLIALCGEGTFWLSCGGSLLRVAAGFALALLCGTGLAFLSVFCSPADALISPALHVVRATPVASFILIALIWLKSGLVPVFIAFLMVLPVVWGNLCAGLKNADRQLLEVAAVYRFSRAKTVRTVYLPAARPYFFAAVQTGAGLAWKAGIAAEALGRTALSIGRAIYDSKSYLETADLFAWTAALILLSALFEALLLRLLRAWSARGPKGGVIHGK